MVFEIFFYAAAILTTLTVYGLARRESVPTAQAIATALDHIDDISWEADLSAMDDLLEVEPEAQPEETPVMVDRVVPFHRPIKRVDYSALNSYQLRAECSARGIKWRGVKGGKHLSKREMIQALTA